MNERHSYLDSNKGNIHKIHSTKISTNTFTEAPRIILDWMIGEDAYIYMYIYSFKMATASCVAHYNLKYV